MMTMVKPNVSAVSWGTPKRAMRCATGSPSAAPEKAPEITAIRVMPLWTVERKRPGSAARSSAVWAPCRPARAIALSRVRREETIASSDMASRPLRITSSRMMITSHQGKGASGGDGGMSVGAILAAKGGARQYNPPRFSPAFAGENLGAARLEEGAQHLARLLLADPGIDFGG